MLFFILEDLDDVFSFSQARLQVFDLLVEMVGITFRLLHSLDELSDLLLSPVEFHQLILNRCGGFLLPQVQRGLKVLALFFLKAEFLLLVRGLFQSRKSAFFFIFEGLLRRFKLVFEVTDGFSLHHSQFFFFGLRSG